MGARYLCPLPGILGFSTVHRRSEVIGVLLARERASIGPSWTKTSASKICYPENPLVKVKVPLSGGWRRVLPGVSSLDGAYQLNLEGLRVVDASVMPDVIRANTNATTIMTAERVADWIKEGR
jgi:hypothetical protein